MCFFIKFTESVLGKKHLTTDCSDGNTTKIRLCHSDEGHMNQTAAEEGGCRFLIKPGGKGCSSEEAPLEIYSLN